MSTPKNPDDQSLYPESDTDFLGVPAEAREAKAEAPPPVAAKDNAPYEPTLAPPLGRPVPAPEPTFEPTLPPKQRIPLKDLAAAPAGETRIAGGTGARPTAPARPAATPAPTLAPAATPAPAPAGAKSTASLSPLASRIPENFGDELETVDPDTVVGSELAGYMVLKKLAEGGMGVVYVGEHTKIGRKSAIKLLKLEYCKNADVVERFKQEARAVNAIRHENIVDIFDFGTDPEGRAFFVMELLRGEALAERVKRGPLTFGEALPLLEQSFRALKAAHDKGFAHRDLKPDNIWLQVKNDGTTQVKLLDFGIAKLLGGESPQEKLTKTGTIIGTPDYMSPEQINGDVDIDHRTDLYSMGIIIYELFAGVTPFPGNTLAQIMTGHLFKDPPRLENIPDELGVPDGVAEIVDRLLAKQPKDRYASAGDVIADLRAVAGDRAPVVALAIKERTVPPPRRNQPAADGDGFDSATSPVARRPAAGRPAWMWPAIASVAVIAVVGALVVTAGGKKTAGPVAQPAPRTPDKPVPPPAEPALDIEQVKKDSLALLRNSLREAEPRTRVLGAEALADAHDQASVPAISELVEKDPDDEVRGRAAGALGELGATSMVATLGQLEKTASPPLKVWYASAQARMGDKAARKRLIKYAADPNLAIAFKAGLALADASSPADKDALDVLAALAAREAELNQISPYAGAVILSRLAKLRHAKARSILYAVLGEKDEGARLAAAEGLARVGDDGGKQVLLDVLGNEASPNRIVAAVALIELGDYSGFELLGTRLADKDPEIRGMAAAALGQIGEHASLRPLVALLGDKDPAVRIAAAGALLAVIGIDPEVLAKAAVDWTQSALASEDWAVRKAAAGVIGDLPEKEALPLLAQAIVDPDPKVRRAAAKSAGKLRGPAASQQVVAAVKVEKDPETKEQMVKSLGQIGDPGAHDVLVEIAADPGRVGVLASGSLVAVGDAAGVTRLEQAVLDSKQEIRLASIEGSVVATNPLVVPALEKGVADKQLPVRLAAAEALAGYGAGKDAAVAVLLDALATSKDQVIQARALAALGRFGVKPPGSAITPAEMLDSPDPVVRRAAVPVIAAMSWSEARPLLRRAAVDPDAEVRRGVAEALARWAPTEKPDVVKQYKVLIEDDDPATRATSQAQLSRLVEPIASAPKAAPAPAPVPPPADLGPLQAAVDEAKAARDEAKAARAVVDQKIAAIDAAAATGAADDENVVRAVELLADDLEVAGGKLIAAAAHAHDAAERAHAAAGASPTPEAQALLGEADGAAADADKLAAGSADAVKTSKAKASAYARAETGDPDMYLSAADAEIATGKLADAKRDLDKARAGYKKAGQKNASLDWSYAQLYDRMAQREKNAAQRLELLKKAKTSYDAFAKTGGGARAKQAAARSEEIAEEIAGGAQ